MITVFNAALGDPVIFLQELRALAQQFRETTQVKQPALSDIRHAVSTRNYEITPDALFRPTVAAFAVLLIDSHAQQIRIRGLFRKRLMVESHQFSAELTDLFYRCVFEGIDLDVTGENQPRES